MAAKLGGVFLACAMGPVQHAAACILASKMPQGIEQLAPDALLGGVRLGVQQAAKLAGVKPQDVEAVLPMGELAAQLEQLRKSQPAALEAWRMHAGPLGSLLQGVADLTVDGRAILPSAGLARISRKVRRDKHFAAPVQALADDMLAWEELLERCKQALEGGADLKKAYLMRRGRDALFALGVLVAGAGVMTEALFVRASRSRIDEAIAAADVCVVEGVAARDLVRARPEQLAELSERWQACAAGRAHAAYLKQDAILQEETAKEIARRQEELDQRCEALAERAKAGKVTADDLALAGDRKALLGRIRIKQIAAKDLSKQLPALPCEGTRAEPAMREAFVRAAVSSIWNWIGGVDPGPDTLALLSPRAGEMSEKARVVLAARADELAKRAIRRPTEDRIGRARRVCALAAALGVPGGEPCDEAKELTPAKER